MVKVRAIVLKKVILEDKGNSLGEVIVEDNGNSLE